MVMRTRYSRYCNRHHSGTLAPTEILEHLKRRLAELVDRLPLAQQGGLLSVVLKLPYVPFSAPSWDGPYFRLVHRQRQTLRAGYGIAAEWRATGPGRFTQLREKAAVLRRCWQHLDPDETGGQGFALLGFAADARGEEPIRGPGLPNALFWIPELALSASRGQGAVVLTTTLPAAPAVVAARWQTWLDRILRGHPPPYSVPAHEAKPLKRLGDWPDVEAWDRLVAEALDQIGESRFDKVVLARRLRVESLQPFSSDRLIAALVELFPSCQLIEVHRDGASFVAATPERLLSRSGDWIEVDAIAGTVGRAASLDGDAALSQALLTSHKDRREHDLVIEAVRAALAGCCERIEVPDTPSVMRLRNAQHLWSTVRAKLCSDLDVFRLAELLHPTPATNGKPRDAASDWLRRAEIVDRGWYTGAAGVIEPHLSGELWVLLRCAQIRGATADLFAGAGIVAGSQPICEWQETEDKLAAMLMALRFA